LELEKDSSCVQNLNCEWWRCEVDKRVCSRDGSGPHWYPVSLATPPEAGAVCESYTITVEVYDSSSCCTTDYSNYNDDEGEYEDCPSGTVNCDCAKNCATSASSCDECTIFEERTYYTYYGQYGEALPCEGETPERISDESYCGDGWDNNCAGRDEECLQEPLLGGAMGSSSVSSDSPQAASLRYVPMT
jgi:hypothetical protein